MRHLKTIVLVAATSLLFGFSYAEEPEETEEQETTVYVCNSSGACRYHNEYGCRGLQSCTHGIYSVTVGKAQSMGRTPCKVCY